MWRKIHSEKGWTPNSKISEHNVWNEETESSTIAELVQIKYRRIQDEQESKTLQKNQQPLWL